MLKHMRRLPVYFLIDVSDSMVGEPIEAVQNGMEMVITQMRGDPYALETMYLSVLVFAARAEIRAPLEELIVFKLPDLPISTGTSLGAGLNLLMDCLEMDIQKTTKAKKGDWKPLIFLFTDGAPTDAPTNAISRWNKKYRAGANLIVVTFGDNADINLLQQLSETVLTLKDTTPASFREFFRWVSASMQVSSQAALESGIESAPLPSYCINLEKGKSKPYVDEHFVILPMKCYKHKDFWLAKYGRSSNGWNLIGSYQVDEETYRHLGYGKIHVAAIDICAVDQIPSCPICGNNIGVVQCPSCSQLFCYPDEQGGCCPWCKTRIGAITEVDSMQVGRSAG